MKRIISGALVAGSVMYGAVGCGGVEQEPMPAATTATTRPTTTETSIVIDQKMIDAHAERAEHMREARLQEFAGEIAAGKARISYDNGNCVTFSDEANDYIVKNPGKISRITDGASLDFYVHVTPSAEGVAQAQAGPYEYYHQALGGVPLSDAETWKMNDVTNPEFAPVVAIETDGSTSWLLAKDQAGNPTVRVSETAVVPYKDGAADFDTLAVVSAQLCGQPAGMIPPTQS